MNKRIGEIGYNTKGDKMIIIAYRNANDIDIQFEDGSISYHKQYRYFKDGRIAHPIKYEESIAYYIEVELGLNLDDVWNWGKNKVNPREISKGSKQNIWVYCRFNDEHNYDRYGNKIGYKTNCNNFTKGYKCCYCKGQHNIHWKDSLAYNYPQIARMIAIEENNLTFEDCYSVSCKSSKSFYFKCSECGNISSNKKSLNSIMSQGYSCEICSDGISIPNKFMSNLLNQLNVNFKSEHSPYYFRNTQHIDFLLTDYNIIIEMDGGMGNHTREYDYWRDFLNIKYGGYKTIRIDLKDDKKYNSNIFKYIKEEVEKSELFKLFNINDINWDLIFLNCQKSKCIESWKLWNNGLTTFDISKILKLSDACIRNYLKRGVEYGFCSYTVNEANKRAGNKRRVKEGSNE